MTKHFITLLTLTTLASAAWAAPQSFDFKDPKGVNNAVFKLDAPLEAIHYERRFVPGLDFLGAALLGASLLAGGSFLFRNKQTTN